MLPSNNTGNNCVELETCPDRWIVCVHEIYSSLGCCTNNLPIRMILKKLFKEESAHIAFYCLYCNVLQTKINI
mgnify:CR=1 FL=1